MKIDSKWNDYAHFHFKSLLLKQPKQEAIILASSKWWSKQKYICKKKYIERSLNHDNFIVNNAVETSVVEAAKKIH